MMYPIVLGLHITAALVTGVIIAFVLYALRYETSGWYRQLALVLGFVAAFEVVSGTVLALLSPELSAASLTLHIAEYLGVCFLAEAFLFARMQKLALQFPAKLAASPVVASVFLFALVLSSGF